MGISTVLPYQIHESLEWCNFTRILYLGIVWDFYENTCYWYKIGSCKVSTLVKLKEDYYLDI